MRIALAAAVLLGACSGGSSTPDAVPPPPDAMSCDSGGGDPFDLRFGYLADEQFVEWVEGSDATLILGAQGIYMLHLEMRADLALSDEQICLTCRISVGPTEAGFRGTEQTGGIGFGRLGDGAYASAVNVLLDSREAADTFADSESFVTMECNGNGFSGSVERHVVLRVPPS